MSDTTTLGLGVNSSGVQTDPDTAEFNPNGESWTFEMNQHVFLQEINWGSIQNGEAIELQSDAWINLSGIAPGSADVTYNSTTGTFRFANGTPADDIYNLTAITGGAPLAIPAGANVFVGNMTSTFGPSDNITIETLTLTSSALNLDFGDAPSAAQSGFAASYPVTLAGSGARHHAAGAFLGSTRDLESDGTHSAGSTADGADEDGVSFGTLNIGSTGSATVVVGGISSRVTVFLDLNRNGSWSDAGELVYNNVLPVGSNPITFNIPVTASAGTTHARVRIGTVESEINVPTGAAANGEVEDYQVTLVAPASGTLTATLVLGDLTITDTDAAGKANTLSAKLVNSGADLEITDANEQFVAAPLGGSLSNGNKTLTIPFSSVTGSITFNTAGGNDALTLDLGTGDFIRAAGLAFNGGNPTTGPGDALTITGGAQGTVTYNYTNASDGSIVMSSFGTVSYTGLEPITNSGTATDIIFNLPATANTATLGDDAGGSGNTLSTLAGANFEDTTFANPTGSLTINRGTASDTLTINALPNFNASLTIGTAADPFSTVSFAGAVALGATNALSAFASTTISNTAAGTLGAGGDISLTAGTDVTINGNIAKSAGADATLTIRANNNVTFASSADVTSTSNKLHVILNSDRDASGSGFISLGSGTAFTSNDGNVTLGGGADPTMNPARGTPGVANFGVQLSGASITAGAGDISIRGQGSAAGANARGIILDLSSSLATTTGDINLHGVGGNATGTASTAGILIGPLTNTATITTVDGAVSLTGQGGSATAGNIFGVVLQNAGTSVTATGTGSITIEGTGGTGSGAVDNGVGMNGNPLIQVNTGALQITGTATSGNSSGVRLSTTSSGRLVSTGSGPITIMGTGAGSGFGFQAGFDSVVGGANATGDITLIADAIDLAGTTMSVQTTGTVTLKQKTNMPTPTAITLGAADGAGVLGLTDAELDRITAGTVQIGDANSGAISINAVISPLNYKTLSIGKAASFSATGGFESEVTSATVFEKMQVAGALSIDPAATLSVTAVGGFVPAGGDSFSLIENTSADDTTGAFSGKPEGATVPVGGVDKKLTYQGGPGANDVVLQGGTSTIDVATLDGSNGFTINGEAAFHNSGISVSDAGDVNGDGFDDVIVGAGFANSFSGFSYVVFGAAGGFTAEVELSALDGTNGFQLSGSGGEASGRSVSSAGDVNGDGLDDLIIGAFFATANGNAYAGAAYVVFGKSDFSGTAGNIDLSTLDGTTGFRLNGAAADDFSGYSVSGAGDVNGDGFDDVIVSAGNADPNGMGSGASYVVFGKADFSGSPELDLSALDGTNGFRLSGVAAEDYAGDTVSAAGDINGDGFADLVVSAAAADPNGSSSGASYVVFGKASFSSTAGDLDLSTLDGTNGFKVSGVAVDDRSGSALSAAGDINGDGFGDLLIGARNADPNGDYSGASYVVFGRANGGFAPNLDLSTLDGTNGFKLSGPAAGDYSGFSVSGAGDFNGDGFDDLIIGAPSGNPANTVNASYVVFGQASFASTAGDFQLSAIDGTNGFKLANAGDERFGFAVSGAGDVNGDGFDDIIIGALGASPNGGGSGASYVIFGFDTGAVTHLGGSGADSLTGDANANVIIGGQNSDTLVGNGGADVMRGGEGGDLFEVPDVTFARIVGGSGFDTLFLDTAGATLDLTALADNRLTGIEFIDLNFGGGANTLRLDQLEVLNLSGDSNTLFVLGDDQDRLEMEAGWTRGADEPFFGFTLKVFTKGAATLKVAEGVTVSASLQLSSLDGNTGFTLNGVDASDRAGYSVSDAGDLNGDGFDDVIVSANWADPNGDYSGAAYVVFGKGSGFPAALELSTLDGTNGFKLSGAAAFDFTGISVSAAGDVNGDGLADLIIGSYLPPNGGAYVVFGQTDFSTTAGNIELSALDGTDGFKITGAADGDRVGRSVGAGDVNGDGFSDLIVGAPYADPNGNRSGAAYVVFGKADFSTTPDFNLSAINGNNGFKLSGEAASDFAGRAVSGAGDVNGDGFADVLIGAPGSDYGGDFSGVSYVVFGKAGGFAADTNLSTLNGTNGFKLAPAAAGDAAGYSVSTAGDVNGDGFDDLIVGVRQADPNGFESGASYVIFGKADFSAAGGVVVLEDDYAGFRISGTAAGDYSGWSVSGAGDVNGDGFDDVIIGAVGAVQDGIPFSGASYVVFGKADFSALGGNLDLSALDGTNGFKINGEIGSQLGWSVSTAGDVNGDGFDDLIVGAIIASAGGTYAGEAYVIFGFDTGAVTHQGGAGAQTLFGDADANVLIGGTGGDSIRGNGGADVMRGGEGDDTLTAPDLAFAEIAGGNGFDTLLIPGSGQTLDLTALADNKLTGIERIDIGGMTGPQTLTLDVREVLNLSNTSNTLIVARNPDDTVNIGTGWTSAGTEDIAGTTFDVYTQGAAILKVQSAGGGGDVVTINGTGGNDTIRLVRNAGNPNLVNVFVNKAATGTPTQIVDVTAIDGLVIDGLGGIDTIVAQGASPLDFGAAFLTLEGEKIYVKTSLTAASFSTEGVKLTVSANKNITATAGDITLVQSGSVSASQSDFSASESGDGDISITGGAGAFDVRVRKVTTDGGDFTTSSGRYFTARGDISTDAGAISIDHGGNVRLRGDVTGASISSRGATLFVTAGKTLSATAGDISIVHTRHISAATASFSAADGGDGDITLTGGAGAFEVKVLNVTTDGGDFMSSSGRGFRANGLITAGGGAITLNHGGAVTVEADVTGGSFSTTGTSFDSFAGADITVAGIMTFNHSQTMDIRGKVDALSYAVGGAGAMNFTRTGAVAFHVDVADPPTAALLEKTGPGKLTFLSGSRVIVDAISSGAVTAGGPHPLAIASVLANKGFTVQRIGAESARIGAVTADADSIDFMIV